MNESNLPAEALPPPSRRVVASLGRGGMGVVYRAEELKLGHPDREAA